jgi:pyruvate kinase
VGRCSGRVGRPAGRGVLETSNHFVTSPFPDDHASPAGRDDASHVLGGSSDVGHAVDARHGDELTLARRAFDELAAVREDVIREADATLDAWRPWITRPGFTASAANLAAYISIRRHDLRVLQLDLMTLGLSSLGRCEARVLENLDAVLATLAHLARADPVLYRFPDPDAFFAGSTMLRAESESVFGPAPSEREVYIMVTLPSEAAVDGRLVHDLVANGMDVARINCAHDDAGAWRAMAANVRAAAETLDRSCRVAVDLVGPRARTGVVAADDPAIRVSPGDRVLLVAEPRERSPGDPPYVVCSLEEALPQLHPGHRVMIDEGSLEAVVLEAGGGSALLEVMRAPAKGFRLRPGKGMNFPTTPLALDPLTANDLAALDVVAGFADVVGYSFVQRPEDMHRLVDELESRTRREISLIAKIETRLAVENLPRIIVAAAGRRPLAVMIARGDLAVEIGHVRLAEIQEELLWLCEAAHVPVIWATQVLDTFVKKGVHHRGEMTDAAMAERAECVMLNKGPFVREGVAVLSDVLGRMEGHQSKKTSRLRALRAW